MLKFTLPYKKDLGKRAKLCFRYFPCEIYFFDIFRLTEKSKQMNNDGHYTECRISLLAD